MKSPLDPRKIELIDDMVAGIMRGKSPAERLALAFDCNRTVRLRIAGHLHTIHPQWTKEQVQVEIARRMLLGAG